MAMAGRPCFHDQRPVHACMAVHGRRPDTGCANKTLAVGPRCPQLLVRPTKRAMAPGPERHLKLDVVTCRPGAGQGSHTGRGGKLAPQAPRRELRLQQKRFEAHHARHFLRGGGVPGTPSVGTHACMHHTTRTRLPASSAAFDGWMGGGQKGYLSYAGPERPL